jgi:leucyl-tRNA---protein transferase
LPPTRGSALLPGVRLFLHESSIDYARYHFAYTQWAELPPEEDPGAAYAEGFLPASHDLAEKRCLFYRARSLRLDLGRLALDKKRRYLHRRAAEAGLRWERQSLASFRDIAPAGWSERLLGWVAQRHDPPFMTAARLAYLLERPFLRQVVTIHAGEQWVGLVCLPAARDWAHYWFCFFDPTWEPTLSPGKWILAETAHRLRESGTRHLYLGTAYGPKSAYKFQGFTAGVEFFDGEGWSDDLTELARRQGFDPA